MRREDAMTAPGEGPKDATPVTYAMNRAVLETLPFADTIGGSLESAPVL
jgi:hypothetical protein